MMQTLTLPTNNPNNPNNPNRPKQLNAPSVSSSDQLNWASLSTFNQALRLHLGVNTFTLSIPRSLTLSLSLCVFSHSLCPRHIYIYIYIYMMHIGVGKESCETSFCSYPSFLHHLEYPSVPAHLHLHASDWESAGLCIAPRRGRRRGGKRGRRRAAGLLPGSEGAEESDLAGLPGPW